MVGLDVPTILASTQKAQQPLRWLDALKSLPGYLLPSVSVEPSYGWWTDNNSFGNRFTGALPTEGQVIPIANCDALPGPPRVIGLSFFRSPQAIAIGPTVNSEVRAEVVYGAGGVSNTLLLDGTNGCNFTVVANTVRVQYRTYRPNPFAAYVPQTDLILAATLGLGPCAPGIPPTFTTPLAVAAAGLPAVFPVPEFARRVSFLGGEGPGPSVLTLAELLITFNRPSGSVMNTFVPTTTEDLFRGAAGGYVLPADCAFVAVARTAGLDKAVQAVFQLGI